MVSCLSPVTMYSSTHRLLKGKKEDGETAIQHTTKRGRETKKLHQGKLPGTSQPSKQEREDGEGAHKATPLGAEQKP